METFHPPKNTTRRRGVAAATAVLMTVAGMACAREGQDTSPTTTRSSASSTTEHAPITTGAQPEQGMAWPWLPANVDAAAICASGVEVYTNPQNPENKPTQLFIAKTILQANSGKRFGVVWATPHNKTTQVGELLPNTTFQPNSDPSQPNEAFGMNVGNDDPSVAVCFSAAVVNGELPDGRADITPLPTTGPESTIEPQELQGLLY